MSSAYATAYRAIAFEHGSYRATIAESSMYPFLHDGDLVSVVPCRTEDLRPGACCACLFGTGAILHRLVRKTSTEVMLCGDNQTEPVGFANEAVLGRLLDERPCTWKTHFLNCFDRLFLAWGSRFRLFLRARRRIVYILYEEKNTNTESGTL